MKFIKTKLALLLSIISSGLFAQAPTTIYELPNYAAKTPEAAAFLKYGEYPVNLSTGVPNISIPLYTVGIQDFSLPISIDYHASGIKVNQEASWVGLGWNLNFGAQVILNAKGDIDENNSSIDTFPLDSDLTYYNSANHPYAFNNGPIFGQSTNESKIKDFYQFSSPTANGSFYIKNCATNDVVIYPPEAFKVKLVGGSRSVMTFEITDTSGNVYILSTTERSTRALTHNDSYISAWYVSRIITANKNIIDFTYASGGDIVEKSKTQRVEIRVDGTNCGCYSDFESVVRSTSPVLNTDTSTTTASKKIKEIIFNNNQSKVVFATAGTRQDLVNGNAYLDRMEIRQLNTTTGVFDLVRGYGFIHSYFNPTATGTTAYQLKRLKLDRVETLLEGDAHEFVYSTTPLPSKISYSQDHFGYYNGANNSDLIEKYPYMSGFLGSANRDVNGVYSQAGILKEIHYPTKGWTQFIFETNNYLGSTTHISTGGVEVWSGEYHTQAPYGTATNPLTTSSDFTIEATSGIQTLTTTVHNNIAPDKIHLLQHQFVRVMIYQGNQVVYEGFKLRDLETEVQTMDLDPGDYTLVVECYGQNVQMWATFLTKKNITVTGNLSSAGLRIARLENYDSDNTLILKKQYDYSVPGTTSSSASFSNQWIISYLVNAPANYSISGSCFNFNARQSVASYSQYQTESNTVLYEYVKETAIDVKNSINNGYTLYKFNIEPDSYADPTVLAYVPWAQGKLLEKSYFKTVLNTDYLVRKEVNTPFLDNSKTSNIQGFKVVRRAYVNVSEDSGNPTVPPYPYSVLAGSNGMPSSATDAAYFVKYNYNIPWQYIKDTEITENFFDTSNNVIGTVVSKKTYNYNSPSHLQLGGETTVASSGEILETKYFYPGDSDVASEPVVASLITKNILSPLKTQTFRNSQKLSETKTVYKDWGNGILLPELVQQAKGTNTPETRIRYTKIDNLNGNVLGLQMEGGINVCYLWGYNGTLPIAKIENATFDQAKAALGADEAAIKAMIITPSSIRTLLPYAMITTFTYTPLKGVESITDPKGMKTSYIYDNQGRLLQVKDNNGYILSENKYNYKP